MALYKLSQLLNWDIFVRTATGALLPLRPLNHQCDSIAQRICLAVGVLTGRYDALKWDSDDVPEADVPSPPEPYQPSPEELKRGYYAEVDIRELTKPVNGHRAVVGAYWLTRNGNPLVWHRGRSVAPQFNRHKELVEGLAARRGEGYGALYIEVAYVKEH